MLSILIPIYNVEVTRLVNDLVMQSQKLAIPFEVICLDDGSKERYKKSNRPINALIGVNYVELSENMGRSKIRNQLARLARYDYILYLDADSIVPSKRFIRNYLDQIEKHPTAVLNGGRRYKKKPPQDVDKWLHYQYGVQRESRSATKRNRRKAELFHSNNYAIPRQIQLDFPYPEDLELYGYEDLFFASLLENEDVDVIHIDNPIVHGQLIRSLDFLSNMRSAVVNLAFLYRHKKFRHTRLLRTALWLKKRGLSGFVKCAIAPLEARFESKLLSKPTVLWYLDLLRLHWLLAELEVFQKEKPGGAHRRS